MVRPYTYNICCAIYLADFGRQSSSKTIAVVGAGKVDTALARYLLAAGDRVLLAGWGDPFLTRLVDDTVAPAAEAVRQAEAAVSAVAVLALPLGRVAGLDDATPSRRRERGRAPPADRS